MPKKGDVFLCRICREDAIKVSRDFPDTMSLGEVSPYLRYVNRKKVRSTDMAFVCYKHRKGAKGFIGNPHAIIKKA